MLPFLWLQHAVMISTCSLVLPFLWLQHAVMISTLLHYLDNPHCVTMHMLMLHCWYCISHCGFNCGLKHVCTARLCALRLWWGQYCYRYLICSNTGGSLSWRCPSCVAFPLFMYAYGLRGSSQTLVMAVLGLPLNHSRLLEYFRSLYIFEVTFVKVW